MGKPRSPTQPVYAHHRLLQEIISVGHGDEVSPTTADLDRIARVFPRCGGSWVRLYEGSPDDLNKLRNLAKVAVKKGFVTKTPKWGA